MPVPCVRTPYFNLLAGAHVLAVKDMAGVLTPQSATLLIGALRAEFPEVPIHVHTHDTAGTGVATLLAAVRAGAFITAKIRWECKRAQLQRVTE